MIKNSPKDLQIDVERVNGFKRGVVEDNKDPLKAGRVRVRIHGLHTPKKNKNDIEGIPTNELPWAQPCMPIHEGSVSGFGVWAVPLQGSHVMLFFEDGNISEPRYFASMPGIPEAKEQYSNNNTTVSKHDGFRDPDGKYPTNHRLEEPDFHRLSRGVSNQTLVTTKNQQRDLGVPTALGGNWSEPSSPYNTQYPHSYVISTHGGITVELDSTPGSTRLHLYHPSNSFIEIDNDGNMVVKNNAEKYEIVSSGKNIHIKQQRNLTIDGYSKKRIIGKEDIEIGGNKEVKIEGSINETINGDKDLSVGGDESKTITGSLNVNVTGDVNITSTGNATITASIVNLVGNVKLGITGTMKAILNSIAAAVYNSHTHTHGGDAGVTSPPTQQMGSDSLTTNTTAN